jgi:DUF4097 and DUF4098 domain-containing protein YvlB
MYDEEIMRQTLLTGFLLIGSFAFTGCDFIDPAEWGNSDRYKEDFSSTHKLAAGGRVVLEGFNGGVEILGWEKDEVEVAGTKQAAREETVKAIKIDVTADAGAVRIRARRPDEMNCNCGVRFTLKVPKKVILEEIQTSNGSIRLESVSGNARLRTSNGSIRIWGVDGELNAQTSNGSVDLEKFTGAADVKTSNGRIKAGGVEGSFEARTSNGSIEADVTAVDTGKPVVLATSNGSINLTLEKWQNNEVRATTSNSSINLRLPAGAQAELRAATSHGNVSSEFEVTTTQSSKSRLNGRIGGGGALLDLNTSNGNIRLLKR